ncbi:MAG: type II toxin-antitoxin system PemK/MazF family toxin [Candidatus Latescibacteria bacterium]|nr:type II toxin-antitoxin system PemK/MazF family toxin [Candidatus Latescibacterota bacterium]
MAWARGDVVFVDFPFVDRTGSKLRPALVVSSATYQTERPQDVIVAVISTKTQKYNGNTDYLLQDWQQTGLAQPSVVRCTLLTILAVRIIRKVGSLSARDLQAVSQRLKVALGV